MQIRLNGFIGVILLCFAIFILPVGRVKATRISQGEPVFFSGLLPESWVVFFYLVLVLLFFFLAAAPKGFERYRPATAGLMIALVPWTLWQLGSFSLGEGARMSLGLGFWLLLVGGFFLAVETGRGLSAISLLLLSLCLLPILGKTPVLSLYLEFLANKHAIKVAFIRHLTLSFSSVAFALLPGIFLGYWSFRSERAREWIMTVVNVFQVFPTLSLLGLLMIPLSFLGNSFPFLRSLGISGIGFAPAFIVLVLYCLLPITANAYAGFSGVPEVVRSSGKALGMTDKQLFFRVLLPLASPVLMAGIRTGITQNIGNAILAGLVGAGGMGSLIFLGLAQSAQDLILLGTIPVVVLALGTEIGMERLENEMKKRTGTPYD